MVTQFPDGFHLKLYSTLSVFTQAPVVQKLDSTIHRINHYPVDNATGFPNTYPLDSDLSGIQLLNKWSQMYIHCMGTGTRVVLCWTSIPSGWRSNTLSCFMLKKPG